VLVAFVEAGAPPPQMKIIKQGIITTASAVKIAANLFIAAK
jgi:hypothetical protein